MLESALLVSAEEHSSAWMCLATTVSVFLWFYCVSEQKVPHLTPTPMLFPLLRKPLMTTVVDAICCPPDSIRLSFLLRERGFVQGQCVQGSVPPLSLRKTSMTMEAECTEAIPVATG